MPDSSPFDLERFVAAQDDEDTYLFALAELRAGRKTGHWMWFIFPQIVGLGTSPTSRRYAISSLEEARHYLAHPVLGPRLEEVIRLLIQLQGRTATDIFGAVDATKLCSSLTLFARAASDNSLFGDALDLYFAGAQDSTTHALLGAAS